MLLGFWAFVFVFLDKLSGCLMRSGKGKTQFTCVPCAKKSEDTKIKSLGSSSASPLQVNTVNVFYWITSAFSPSIEDGRCNVVCAAAYEAALCEILLNVACSFAAPGASAAAGMQRALIGFLTLVGVLASHSAIVEVLLCFICRSAAFSGFIGQWVAFAAAGMQQALEGLVALVSVIVLEICFSVTEGLDRHVLAGCLFLGTGEQASGRVDVPARTYCSKPQLQAWDLDCVSRPRKGFKSASPARSPLLHQSLQFVLSWFAPCRDVHGFARFHLDLLWTIWKTASRNTLRTLTLGASSRLSCMADCVGDLPFQELGCAMSVMLQGAGPRRIVASGAVMPEIRVLLLVHLSSRPPLVVRQPILEGLLEPKLPL